jgi:hypothetical protein
MARRSLSMQGRVLAAGACVAIGAGLAGFMAAGDHSADASQSNSSSPSRSNSSVDNGRGSTATPYSQGSDDGFGGFPSRDSGFQPQSQTRTGGS